ncbi:zinc transporter ZntB [Kordiimonas marina]|uniref:zinc transporter ZntB n=1 Tax=Kordiimonas marina TaxID=2872312 RepID=UPI001FF3913D|nr:zinc transporter ZntB [Kordiimonas marina]MCJ9428344.1 zinc transporter ZntB [Kordiimonas marina]
MSKKALLNCYYLDPGDQKEPGSGEEVSLSEEMPPVWLHFDVSGKGAKEAIHKAAPYLDETTIDALCAEDTRPRVEEFGKEYLVILKGANLNPESEPEDMVSLRIWSDGRHIISGQRRRVFAAQKLIDRLKASGKPAKASEVIVGLTINIIDNLGPPVNDLLDEVDALEEDMLKSADIEMRHTLIDLRQRVLALRRYLTPLRQAVGELRELAVEWLGEKATRRLREGHAVLARHIEDLDAARERLQFSQEQLVAESSDRLNRNMYTLSIVAAIFLPLSFLTGLLGINVGGMPGANDASAFWWVTAGCVSVAVALLLYFRRGGWL